MIALLVVFGVVVVVLICVMLYRGTLQNHEDDQIFIDAAMQSMANEQSALIARIEKVSRLIKALYVLSGALFVVSGFQGLGLSHAAAWSASYVVMAALVLIGIATTLIAAEPEKSAAANVVHARESALARVVEAAVGAFSEFLSRDGCRRPRTWRGLSVRGLQ